MPAMCEHGTDEAEGWCAQCVAFGAKEFPPGDYAIVELFGHTTLVGRISEVERFGAKMLALEPLFKGEFLPPIFHGGAAIYRLTPCGAEVAFDRQAKETWELPAAIRAIVPLAMLPPIEPAPVREPEDEDEDIVF